MRLDPIQAARERPPGEAATRRSAWSKAGTRWTDELVAYALDRFHSTHLRTPTLRELRAGVDGLPSYATIKRMYGNAGVMLARHGYRRRRPGAQPGTPLRIKYRDEKGRFLSNDTVERDAHVAA
jgi:hypothetical protein